MMEQAKFQATLKVVVEQIPVPGRYSLSVDFFQDQVESYMRKQIKNEFVRVYTPKEAKVEKLPYVDQVVRIMFDDFVVGQTRLVEKIVEVSKDSVEVGSVKLDDGTEKKAYNTVKASLHTYRKELVSNGQVSMRIVNPESNAVIRHRKFEGSYTWFANWGTYKGDERALSDEQIKMTKRKARNPPERQDLFVAFTRPILNDLTREIQSFYKKY